MTGAPGGTHPVTVTATSGAITHTVTVSLTVVVAPPDFTIGAVNGFAGPVSLSASGLPAKVGTAGLSPANITGPGTAQLSLATVTSARSRSPRPAAPSRTP